MCKYIFGWLPVLLTGLLLLGGGLGFGFLTDRWGASPQLQEAVNCLHKVPRVLGDWQGEDQPPLSDQEVQQAGFAGYLLRNYRNARNGGAISILLACGRPGPISVHTPDICYRGSGFVPRNIERTIQEPNQAEFFRARFGKPKSFDHQELKILWSWNARGPWQAPDNPRLGFAGSTALYKLYVIQEVAGEDSQADSISSDFLAHLLPALERALFPKS